MDIGDLAGLSKPLIKLIETVSRGIGRVTKPYLIRKDAKASSDAIKMISNSMTNASAELVIEYNSKNITIKRDALQTQLNVDNSLQDRMTERTRYQEQLQQYHIEQITQIATQVLMHQKDESINDDPVSDDWLNRFFKEGQDVSSLEMQKIWGRILAGEVSKPGSFSLRTLNVLKNISTEEALLFNKVAKNRFLTESSMSFLVYNEKGYIEKQLKLNFEKRSLLLEAGLLADTEGLAMTYPEVKIRDKVAFRHGKKAVIFEKNGSMTEPELHILGFTSVGEQLATLIDIEPNEMHIQDLIDSLKPYNAIMYLADYKIDEFGKFQYYNLVQK